MDWETIKYNFSEHPVGTIIVFLIGIGMIVASIIAVSFGAGFGCLFPFALGVHLLTLLFLQLTDNNGIIGTIIAYPVCMTIGTIGIGVGAESVAFLIIGIAVTVVITVILLRDKLSNHKNESKTVCKQTADIYNIQTSKNYEFKRKCFCAYILGSVNQLEQMEGLHPSPFLLDGNENQIIPVIKEISNTFDILFYEKPYCQKGGFSTYSGQILTTYNAVLHDLYEKLIYGNNEKLNRANRWKESTVSQFHISLFSIANILNFNYSKETKEMFDSLINSYDYIFSIANETTSNQVAISKKQKEDKAPKADKKDYKLLFDCLKGFSENIEPVSFQKNINTDLDIIIFSLFNVYKTTLQKHMISKSQKLWYHFEELIFSEFEDRGLIEDFIDKFLDQRIQKYNRICQDSVGKQNPYKELIFALTLFIESYALNDPISERIPIASIDEQLQTNAELLQIHADIDTVIFPYLKEILNRFDEEF